VEATLALLLKCVALKTIATIILLVIVITTVHKVMKTTIALNVLVLKMCLELDTNNF
jgi:hypothetical protein